MPKIEIELNGSVTVDDALLSGVPAVTGTRIPLSQVLAFLAEGDGTLKDFCTDFDVDFKQFSSALMVLSGGLIESELIQ